jgi:hypothetical protein
MAITNQRVVLKGRSNAARLTGDEGRGDTDDARDFAAEGRVPKCVKGDVATVAMGDDEVTSLRVLRAGVSKLHGEALPRVETVAMAIVEERAKQAGPGEGFKANASRRQRAFDGLAQLGVWLGPRCVRCEGAVDERDDVVG